MSSVISGPGEPLRGVAKVPPDKSISHRSVIFGAIADGVTTVSNLLEGEDVLATIAAFRSMGVTIEGPDAGNVIINGVGRNGLEAAGCALNLGNSGTSMRLLSGLLAGQTFGSRLTGDASLQRRPMTRVVEPLTKMGAWIDSVDGLPPLDIQGPAGEVPEKFNQFKFLFSCTVTVDKFTSEPVPQIIIKDIMKID